MSFISKTVKRKSASLQSIANEAVMSNRCQKCGEPVAMADRMTILGKDWHSNCLTCDKCDKALTPGQLSAHLNKTYCNSCYQSIIGSEGFRQATGEPRKFVIKGTPTTTRRNTLSKSDIKTRIKEYNLYKTSPVEKLKSRETNGQILFEGILKLYWGLKHPISLSPGVIYSKRQSVMRGSIVDFANMDDDAYRIMLDEAEKEKWKKTVESEKSGKKLHKIVSSGWDSQDRMPLKDTDDLESFSLSLPVGGFTSRGLPGSMEYKNGVRRMSEDSDSADEADGSVNAKLLTRGTSVDTGVFNSRSPIRKRSASFRKISKQKRMEGKTQSEMRHQFTPPYGSPTSVRVTSIIPTKDVILMLIAKYKVENSVDKFNLCVIHDSGAQEYLSSDDYPLQHRLKLGPSEDIAKIFIVEADLFDEETPLTEEVATWIKFSHAELNQFAKKFEEEMVKEEGKIRKKFKDIQNVLKEQLKNGRTEYHESDI